MRDDNQQMKQEQDEHEQFMNEQIKLRLNSMSDEEFFKLLGHIECEVKNVSL